ncbi:hypothetical protein SO802_001140 [Lithocarpus litseifolius]|uniref:Uncharacterized protein n=1 Tax=Lithocarpus litseifolius TaxID=425828 RepID=A0AAW2DYQ8_9ROSI
MKVFIWFLFFLPIVYAAEHYDYFQLVLQWPPTVCRGPCTRPVQQNFTIHGLWPSDSTMPGHPINCTGSQFDATLIKDLTPSLDKFWPNLTGDNEYFWRNQWESHGTCSEDTFNEHGYFSKALELKENVDILGYLDDGGIKPLPPKVVYRSSDISDVIEHGGHKFNGTGHKPRLWCSEDNKLLEISVCYNLDLAYTDCPPKLLNYSSHICKDQCVGFPDFPYPPPPLLASAVSY